VRQEVTGARVALIELMAQRLVEDLQVIETAFYRVIHEALGTIVTPTSTQAE